MTNISTSDGIWPNPYGTTATGLPFLGGQITAEELRRGEIRHVIGIALVDLEKASVFSWPATRSDGSNPNNTANRIPQGTRFRLDPTVNVDALSMSGAGKVIAKAAQKYGFVVWDKSAAIGIRAQNPQSYIAQGQPDMFVLYIWFSRVTSMPVAATDRRCAADAHGWCLRLAPCQRVPCRASDAGLACG